MYVHTFDRDNCIGLHHPFTVLSYAAIPSSIGHRHWTNGESPAGEHVVRAGERSWEHSLPEDGGSGLTGGCTLQSDVLPNNGLRVCGWESDDGRGGVGEGVCSVGERVPLHTACTHTHTHTHTKHAVKTTSKANRPLALAVCLHHDLSNLCDIPYMDVAWRPTTIWLDYWKATSTHLPVALRPPPHTNRLALQPVANGSMQHTHCTPYHVVDQRHRGASDPPTPWLTHTRDTEEPATLPPLDWHTPNHQMTLHLRTAWLAIFARNLFSHFSQVKSYKSFMAHMHSEWITF